MQKSIKDFTTRTSSGLYLIDMPTGSGKTYNCIEYIYNNYKNIEGKIYFITTLNKNIDDAYYSLKHKFEKNNTFGEFEQIALRICSNSEEVINNINKVNIPEKDEIIKFDSFLNLKSAIQSLEKATADKYDKEILENLLKSIKDHYEPQFREDVKLYLNEKKKNKKDRFAYVRDNHSWLIKLYPSIETDFKKIYFLSMDKFYLENDTLIEPKYRFINHKNIENSMIFIDEIDSTKNVILNRQIEESLKKNLDLVKVFSNIYSVIKSKEFPNALLKSCGVGENKQENKQIFDKICSVFENTYLDNNLRYDFKLFEKDDDKKFIFEDHQTLTITSLKQKGHLAINTSTVDNYNYIVYGEGENKLESVINRISGAIKYFINGCYYLSCNYMSYYNATRKIIDDIMNIEDAVKSVLRSFNISNEYIPYLSNAILNNYKKKNMNREIFSTDLYETGFKYYKFNDNISNNLNTIIEMHGLNEMPEHFLYRLTTKAKVIGLSATSTMDTVTGNYDLAYLKRKLGKKYYIPSLEEKNRIDEEILKRLNSSSNIYVEAMDANDSSESINKIYENIDYKDWLKNQIKIIGEEDYNIKRFLKISLAIKSFLETTLSSMLILTNRNLKSTGLYSYKTMKDFIDKLILEKEYNFEYEIVNLTSNDFEENKARYQQGIKEKKKVIIFSSYPTTGAGQNLQYEEEINGELVKEDINCLYIEKPTNMIVNSNLFTEKDNADLIKHIAQLEFLQSNGEISINDKMACVKEAFLRTYDKSAKRKHKNIYECNSVKNNAISVLIQAVGRICRTNKKTKDTNIYVDMDIFDTLDLASVAERRLNREFISIIDKFKEVDLKNQNTEKYLIDILNAENNNRIINYNINRVAKYREWSKANISDWKSIREYVLRYPTLPPSEYEISPYIDCYLKSHEDINYYYYSQENDFGDVSISYDKTRDIHSIVSARDSKLNILSEVEFLKNKFLEKGYALDFRNSKYIMIPVIYNNIFKGALGEFVGKTILEHFDITIFEIEDSEFFEIFDYVINDVYIDFKLWNNTGFGYDINHAQDKLKKVKSNKLLTINIVGNNLEPIHIQSGISIIPSLIDETTMEININAINYIKEVINNGN